MKRNAVVAAPKAKTAAKLLKPMRVVRFIMNTVKMRVLTELLESDVRIRPWSYPSGSTSHDWFFSATRHSPAKP